MPELIIDALQPLKVPIDSVQPDPENVRRHPDSNRKAIADSLQGFQQRKPIVVNKRTMTIEAGNGLWQEMKALGATEIAAVFVDDTDQKAKAYGIMDNRSSELAEWDFPQLKDLIEELDTGEIDTDLTGWTPDELEDMMTSAPDFSKVSQPSQASIDDERKRMEQEFEARAAAWRQQLIELVCPECGHTYQVQAGDVIKETQHRTTT